MWGGEKNISINFPIGKIDDIIVFFQHDKHFSDAKIKWDERKKRINNKIIIFLNDCNCSMNDYYEFKKINCERKYFITGNKVFKDLESVKFIKKMNDDKKLWYETMKHHLAKKYYEQIEFSDCLNNNI